MSDEITYPNLTNINTANIMLYPFAEVSDVFTGDLEKNELVFLPLCTIDLGDNRRFHIVSPWSIGTDDNHFYDKNIWHYVMRFKIVNNKYQFNDDYQKFARFDELKNWRQEALQEFAAHKKDYMTPKSPEEYLQGEKKQRDTLRAQQDHEHHFYHDRLISYLISKENFRNTGKLVGSTYFTDGYGYGENNILDLFGDQPQWAQDTGELLSKNGTPLIFITQLTGYNYHKNAADNIYLFYDKDAQEAVQVFQWT